MALYRVLSFSNAYWRDYSRDNSGGEEEMKMIEETIQYLDSLIQYAECIKSHLIMCQQLELERDVAVQKLKECGVKKE